LKLADMTGRELLLRIGPPVVAVLLAIHFLGDPLIYFGAPVRGRVVDEATGSPLEGVSIVAEWQLAELSWPGTSAGRRIEVLEATTNAKGEYSIPWWGPALRPPFAALRDRSPRLTYFKGGYYPIVRSNKNDSDAMIRKSDLDGKDLRLTAFDGNFLALSNAFSVSRPDLLGCWRKCPQYVLAVDREANRLRSIARPLGPSFPLPPLLDWMTDEDRSYFLSHLK
jgi:hypothetical protein